MNDNNIEIIEDKANELTFIVHGESHGICNAIRHALMKNDNVEYAVYNIDHPLTGEPEMTIKTKENITPRDALKEAAQYLQSKTNELKDQIEEKL